MDQTQETELSTENSVQHIDESENSGDSSPQNPPAPTPDLDWKLLYAQSIRERQERDAELSALRAQLNAPKPQQEEEVTDADVERLGTTGVIKKIVAQTLRNELSNSLGDIREISSDFKKNKQIAQSEETFFSQFPHLAQYREVLSNTIRGQLNNYQQVDPSIYATQAFATIGYYTAMNAATPPAQPTPQTSQPRQIPPTRGNPPVPAKAQPRLTELERAGMKRIGLDPNKSDDVAEFMRLVNNDEGISV
jgi:hypothetical protein